MFSADRRMQEGTRDLALAFMLGRAEEALSRVSIGDRLDDKERRYFEQLLNLFADALDGYSWAAGTAAEGTPSSDSLRAVALVIPVIREHQELGTPEESLQRLAATARSLLVAEQTSGDERAALADMLRNIASYAAGQGREALDTDAPSVPTFRGGLM